MDHQSPGNVLIFGGSSVIGRAIALPFGREHWTVGVHYHRHQSIAKETAAFIHEAGGKAHLVQADVRKPSQIGRRLQHFTQEAGSLQVLIWAVGAGTSSLMIKTSPEDWLGILHINLTGAFHALQAALPIFERQHGGAVILIGSLSGEQGMPGQAAYAASKAGLIGLMMTAAQEWGGLNVRVNTVFPGWHHSPLTEASFDVALQQTPHVLRRTPSLEQVAHTVYHLAMAEDVSGQVWNLDSRIW
jgi:3-oxoacyl-[acyl-carrier protein] reductase